MAARPTSWEPRGSYLLAVPIGSPSDPTPSALAISRGLAARRIDVVVAEPVPRSSIEEGVPERISRPPGVWAGVIIVDAAGRDPGATERATSALRAAGRRVLVWSPSGCVNPSTTRIKGSAATARFLLLAFVADLCRQVSFWDDVRSRAN
jgi:hypothetical protein